VSFFTQIEPSDKAGFLSVGKIGVELSSLHSQLEKWKNGMMEYWVSIPPHSH